MALKCSECSINNPAGAACKTCSPAEIPIMVDETKMTAVVQGGVPTRMFLDYLAAYTCAFPALHSELPSSTCSWPRSSSPPAG